MDGKGRWMDNVFIERTVAIAHVRAGLSVRVRDWLRGSGRIGWWMDFYNECRPHSSLQDRTPEEAYIDDGAEDRSPGLRPVSRKPKAA